ncbi:FAD:protein FMN transferase [Allokutzneria multivorans]|uniref:FAD:protein FMN transferase n=1 Tax=Allokutzneria multivorans TaxID=1142134 RepID=A0ABP7U6X5_9PSEU
MSRTAWVEQIMGMPVSVHLRGAPVGDGMPAAVADVFAELREVDRLFSTYRPDSQISLLGKGELELGDCDPAIAEVLELSDKARAATDGWFDVLLPEADGTYRLDPSGLVKGWAVERAAARLGKRWAGDYYVNAGGDISLCARGERAWRIGVEGGSADTLVGVLPLYGGGIATSGNAHRGGHLVRPDTGAPAAELGSVTVVGPSLMWADVLATAAFVRGVGALEWLQTQDGYDAVVVGLDGTVECTTGIRSVVELTAS